MIRPSTDRLRQAVLPALFVVALGVGIELLRPFVTGAVGFDTAASVIHFDRIAGGRHLEAFVTATPKPLLTLVDGGLMAIFDDWRAVAIASIAAFAGSVALGTWFGGRLGGLAGGVFAAVALIGSRSLLADVTIAYAVPAAMLLWLVAGLAVTARPARPLIAGLALAGATLARLESVAVVGLIVVALPAAAVIGGRRGTPMPRSWWILLVSLVALPIMLVHDFLLTGDPFFWSKVSDAFSRAAPDSVLAPDAVVSTIVHRYVGMPLLTGLALIGLGWLAWRRAVAAFAGLAALSGGVAALLVFLAARGTYVSPRYYAAIDVALIVAAAIGWGACVAGARAGTARRRPSGEGPVRLGGAVGSVAAVVAAGIVGAAAIWPLGSLDASLRSSSRSQRLQAEHADRVLPAIRCALATVPGTGVFPPSTVALAPSDRAEVRLLVPTLLRPRLARDLRLPLDQIGGTPVDWLEPNGAFLPYGSLVFHDRRGDRGDERFAILEVDRPTLIGTITLVPIVADPEAEIWLDWIGRAGGPAAPLDCAETPAG